MSRAEHGSALSRSAPDEMSGAEREELGWLRRENRLLRVENEMLRRIATEYALDDCRVPGPGRPD